MKVLMFPVGPLGTNGYLLYDEKKKGVYIDPGAPSPKIKEWVEREKIKLVAILLTHAHFDHIAGLDWMREWSHAPVYQHISEADWLMDPELNGSGYPQFAGWIPPVRVKRADFLIDREGEWEMGPFRFQVFHTPGHSPGSLTYLIDNLAFSGDLIFRLGVGRTDLPGGDSTALFRSIREKIMELPDETILYPGHGEVTGVGREREENPYVAGGFSWK